MIAALYVDALGPYSRIPGVVCYTVPHAQGGLFRKDYAQNYNGPGPVVAHPPCGPWGKLRHLYRGSDHDCAPRAVEQVRLFGGVLEHPAESMLWAAGLELPRPGLGDRFGGYTIEVEQVEWGHIARKRTWLYCVGVPSLLDGHSSFSALEAPPFPGRAPTHWASGSRGQSSRRGAPVPPGIKVCSAQQRNRTPRLFAEYLVRLAESVRTAKEVESA